jgi:hypothetical protein
MGTENLRLGTCKVLYEDPNGDIDYNGTGVMMTDMGLTIGGVDCEVTTDTRQTKVDQFGETIVDETIIGRNIKVTVPLAETTLENMVALIPGATLITDGTEPTKRYVEVKTGVGTSLIQTARQLVLHPVGLLDDDYSEDVVIPKASAPGAMNFAYKTDQERVFNSDFSGYPTAEGVLFQYGDVTAVV